jgi:DNA-binding SARP family transcriptional activator
MARGNRTPSTTALAEKRIPADRDSATIHSSGSRIQITTFGAFRVTVDGGELPKSAWGRKRARDLFKLLLINHRSAVTVDDIQEKLWGGASSRNIETLVMNAASHIRSALGGGDNRAEGGGNEGGTSLLRVGEGYRLDLGDDVWVDFVRFKELIVAARRSHTVQERKDLYAEAAGLYGGEFLPEDAFAEWSDFQRQILKDAYFEAMEFLMREQLRDGDPDGAIERARRLLTHDDTSEVAYDVLLRGLRERGRLAEARKAYAQCSERYRRAFDSEPPASLRELVVI